MNRKPLPQPIEDEPAPITDAEALSGAVEDERLDRIVKHPDGYYWGTPDGHQEFGPFDTVEEALADMDVEEGEFDSGPPSLEEIEDTLGIAGWIDPETGEPPEDSHIRLEDH